MNNSSRWQWNIAQIQAKDITDNVAGLMINMLKKLPTSTQKTLQFAACIGGKFDLQTLCVISEKSPQEAFRDLEEAIQEGLILPLSELDEQLLIQDYQFRHDRIQQAAYTLITDENKKALHLKIGRLLWQNTLPDQLSEQLFVIVDHFNLGLELVFHQYERTAIARLNLMAGKKAKAATAYDSAIKYFNIGRNLLAENSWKTECELTLELYLESVEVAYLNGNYETVKTLYTVVFERAKTLLEKMSSIPKTTTNTLKTSTKIASTLDLKSILKASQTLSSELSLETLLTKMMGIVLENAGAQKGYLILKQDGQWVIEASGTIASDEVQVLQSIPLAAVSGNSETPMVSNAIANYVIHNQTTLVLDDAAYEGDFIHDAYILKQQPKSILCTPLLNQGMLVGILYLENNLIPGAFTPDRLEVLNLLSPQVAISIENAKLYAQLRESDSKWTRILEAVPIGVSVHNIDSQISYLNQSGRRILGQGLRPEATCEELAQAYQLYIAGTDQLYPTEQLPALRALRGETAILEDVEVHQDGIIIPLEVRTTPIFDEQGAIKYGVIAFQDITERRKAEKLLTDYNRTLEAEVSQRTAELTQINQQLEHEIADRKVTEITLKQQKELLQAIFDHLPVMLCFYDTNAQVLLANRAIENILGWSLEELKQIDLLTECYPDPDYRASVFEFMIRADGTWRDLQTKARDGRGLETSWANVRLPDGSQVGIGQDITERKRAEQALRDSEERFREIAETISQFFFVRSVTSGRYLYANPAYERIWGRTCESLYQNPQSWLETIHPDDRSFVQNSIQKQYQGTPVKREYRIIRPDGQVRWIVADISVVCDEIGQPQRFVGLAEDITERKQAEQALRESENRFRAVFEKAAVGIGLCTLEGRFFRVNQKLCSIVGYTDIEMLERTFEQITPVKDRPQMRDFTQQLLAGEIENYSLEHRYICKDGSIAWVNVAVSLMHEPAGEPNSFIYIAEDISDRKLAELALVKSEHALAEAQRLAHVGNWSFDLLTCELTWSEETFRIYGLDPTQGEPSEEEHLQQLHPDDREKVLRSIELAVTQGRPYEHEIRMFLPNGSMRYTLRRGQPVLNEMGQVVKLFGTVQDITERKQAEEELRESEEKFRQLAENIEEVFFILSQAGEVLYISPAYEHIWGKTCQSLYHNPYSWLESVHPQEQQAMLAALNRQIRDAAEFDETYRIVRSDGEIRWIRARSFPIEHQNSHRFVGIAEDISDRKLAEDALQQAKEAAEAANQAKSAFLANMSHELRTPLNAILGFAQLLNRSSSLPPEHKKNITTIIRSGEHLLTLINQILDLSKIEAGRTTLNETSFDLYNFLEDVKDMFQLKANNKGLQLRFEYSSDLPQYVHTDEVKLRQILINLLSNAMKFTASGGVSLRVSKGISQVQENTNSQFPIPNSPLHFEIEDTGSGIASDELESIFEAFVQTKTGQQYREGTGLGLTISRKFVQLMGGEISITSEVGKGTIISFDIQATGVEAAAIESKPPLRRVIALEPNQPLYRILIVDDRTDNRQVLIELLSPFGFELKEASNGLEAIEIWEVWQPHLIFMDMRMPGIDGFETIQRIKATTKGQATAIIALTASSLEEERTAILTAGCDDFIRKPFQEAEIFDALHSSIGVRFIYDEPTATPIKPATRTELSIPAALATLPPDIVADFHKALLELDVGRVQTTIDQIRLLNEPLADAIATFANKFEYEQLLNFILQSNR